MEKRTACFVISVLTIFRVFGFLPLSLTRKKGKILTIISRSEICILYNIILIIITIYTSCITGLPILFEKNFSDLYHINLIMNLVSVAMYIAVCLILWVLCIMNHKKIEEAVHEFLEIDSFMQRICHVEQSKYPFWGSIFTGLTYTAVWSTSIWFASINYRSNVQLIWIFTSIIPAGTVSVYLLHYAFIMQLLTLQFKSLNNAFEKFGTINSSEDGTLVTQQILEDINIRNFQSIKSAHRRLHKLTIMISNFYSFPTLIVVGISCLTIILSVFNMAHNFLMPPIRRSRTELFFVSESLWLAMKIIPILMLIFTLEKLVNEYKRTSVEILNLVSRFEDYQRLSSEAKWFLRVIIHSPMKFTAFGFFDLDSTLFQSILSTTITYLIIAVQFDTSQNHGSNPDLNTFFEVLRSIKQDWPNISLFDPPTPSLVSAQPFPQ